MHQALYRKWRPVSFDEVVGQDHITDVLRYEVQSGRISHAYLFCGSRGTGKTTCAKILAKAANCLSPVNGNPCGECESCRLIESGMATDILEMDAASNTGVDYIRDIKDEVLYAPSALRCRVYIIDEVHMLSESAFNALLKTLEEPPQDVIFILATTEMQKVPATILSRCQSFDFRRIPGDIIASRLMEIAESEAIGLDEEAAYLIARLSSGGMRDSISLLELCMADGGRVTKERVEQVSGCVGSELTSETVRAILRKDTAALFDIIARLYHSSKDISVYWQELLGFYRDMMICKAAGNADDGMLRKEILDATESEMRLLRELSAQMKYETMLYHVRILDEVYLSSIRSGDNKRLAAEMTLLRLTVEQLDTSPEALLKRIAALEDALLTGKVQPRSTSSVKEEPVGDRTEDTVPPADAEPLRREVTEITSWAEIVRTVGRANRSAASFLTKDGGWIDERSVAHIRLHGSFGKSLLSQSDTVTLLKNVISGVMHTEISGITFEVIQLEEKNEPVENNDSVFE